MKTKFKIFAVLLALTAISFNTKAQTMPTPQSLPYTQDFSELKGTTEGAALATVLTYPAGWQGWVVGTARLTDPAPVSAPTADKNLIVGDATSSSGGCYDFAGKMGFLSKNSANLDLALCLSVNTTGKNKIKVSFDAMTVRCLWDGTTETRKNGLVLQYRVGTTGNFTSISYSPAEYNTGETANATGSTGVNVVTGLYAILPGSCDNQPVVQIRWQYRIINSTGANWPSAAIDNVSVRVDETLSNNADLLSLTIDAKADGNFVQPMLFNKNNLQYTYYLTKNNPLPVIAAESESGVATKVITQVTSLNGTEQERTATVEITAEDGTTKKTYSVQFIETDNVFQSGLYTASVSNAPTGWSRVEMYFASSLTDGNNKYEGANYARCNSAVTYSNLRLPSTKSVGTLKFYARKIDNQVVGNLKVSAKIDDGEWTTIQDLGDINNSTYQEFSVTVNQTAVDSMYVRIEITKNGDTYPSQGYYLDDISYSSFTSTDVTKIDNQHNVYALNGQLMLMEGDIFNITGVKVATVKPTSSITAVKLKRGIYIIKSKTGIQKIVLD